MRTFLLNINQRHPTERFKFASTSSKQLDHWRIQWSQIRLRFGSFHIKTVSAPGRIGSGAKSRWCRSPAVWVRGRIWPSTLRESWTRVWRQPHSRGLVTSQSNLWWLCVGQSDWCEWCRAAGWSVSTPEPVPCSCSAHRGWDTCVRSTRGRSFQADDLGYPLSRLPRPHPGRLLMMSPLLTRHEAN